MHKAVLPLLLALAACSGSKTDAPPSVPAADRPAAAAVQKTPEGQVPVRFEPSGKPARILTLEIALTAQQQQVGLSGRKTLASDGGMIFPFLPPRPASFWMKDTLIPLDMIFVRPDGTIAMIADRAKPLDLTPVSTGEDMVAVVELAGGMARGMGLEVGDKVSWGECVHAAAGAMAVRTAMDYCVR